MKRKKNSLELELEQKEQKSVWNRAPAAPGPVQVLLEPNSQPILRTQRWPWPEGART